MSIHGDIIQRVQCPDCASKGGDSSHDNLNVYSDGYAKCFSCNFFEYDREISANGTPVPKKDPIAFVDVSFTALKKRGITEETCKRYGYGISTFYDKTVQVAAYRDDSNNLIGQKLRFANKSFVWTGMSTRRFFGQHLFNDGKFLAITEGELDCLSLAQVLGKAGQVVSLPSGAGLNKVKGVIEENIQYLRRFEEIILFMDDDEEGHAAVEAFAEVLPNVCRQARYVEGHKDCNSMLVAGLEADIKQAFWNAVSIDADDDIKNGNQYTLEDFRTSSPIGYSLPYPGLQEALGGLRKGELTLFTAGSGIGKSTITKEIGFHLIKEHNLKIGNIYMEEQDIQSFQSYVALYLNLKLAELRRNTFLASDEQFYEAQKFIDDRLEFARQSVAWAFDKLMTKIEFMAVAKKCDFVILDHISMAIAGIQTDDERKAIDLLMSHLYQVIDRTGVGIIAVVHLRKPDGDKDWINGLIPTSNSLRGSAGLAQMSFNIIAASRNADDDDERLNTYLHLLKCREWGENVGRCTDKLSFNTATGRLDPTEKFPEKPDPKKKKTSPAAAFAPASREDF